MTDTTEQKTGRFPRATRRIIQGIYGLALGSAVLLGVFGLIGIAAPLVSGDVPAVLPLDSPLPDDADRGTATIVYGSFTSAEATVSGLTVPTLVVFALANLSVLVSTVAAAIALTALCGRLLSADPFRRGLARTLTVGGGIVVIGGAVGAGLNLVLTMMITDQLNASVGDGFWPLAGEVDLSAVTIGVGMLLVGLAFDFGERLQRDSAGLV